MLYIAIETIPNNVTVNLVTVAELVDKRFVPGPGGWKKPSYRLDYLDIIQNVFFLNHEVGHGKEAGFVCDRKLPVPEFT